MEIPLIEIPLYVSVFIFSHGLICFSCKKQHTISLSSTEAEYREAVNASTQCVWLQGILGELSFALDSPTLNWCVNKITMNISIDIVQRHGTKHIEIHMHYILSLVHEQVISLQYWPSAKQTYDIFTKSFKEKTFTYLRSFIGVGNTW